MPGAVQNAEKAIVDTGLLFALVRFKAGWRRQILNQIILHTQTYANKVQKHRYYFGFLTN